MNWPLVPQQIATGILNGGIIALIALGIVLIFKSSEVFNFAQGQLVMLGVGWNFLFVSGTALLPTAHEPGEQYRAQALNDSVVFSSQAVASLSAGWAITAMNWESMLLLCALPLFLMAALLVRQRLAS